MEHSCYGVSDLFDHALKENFNRTRNKHPLVFIKSVIDWDSFTPLLKALYYNDIDNS